MVPENHHDRPLSVSAFWNLVADHNAMVESDREGLKGPYPNFFGKSVVDKTVAADQVPRGTV